jgi:signal peptidase I
MFQKEDYNVSMQEEKRENFFTELLKFALVALVIVVPVRLFVAQPFIVSGISMVPTFEDAQYLIIDEATYHFNAPKRGDVVVFRYPKDPSQFFIKRIIGLPGEVVHINDTGVSITKADGTSEQLDESHIVNRGNGPDQTYTVSEGTYFVMGDNRPESSDSRTWGLLPRKNIVGRVFMRLLPIQSAALFPGYIAEPQ